MTDEPLVSIVMNCLNGSAYIRHALESVARQTYRNWEVVFWDNGSTDGSAETAAQFGNKVRIFRGGTTVGLGAARNLALGQCRGEFIAFLDCDDAWMPAKLEKQIPLFLKGEKTGLVYSDAVNYFQDTGVFFTQFSALRARPPRGAVFPYLFAHYGVSMPTVVLRKSVLEGEREWFDPSFRHSTDYDLFLRLAFRSDCDYVDEPLAVYRLHQSVGLGFGAHEARERRLTIRKLQERFPGFEDTYGRQIADNLRTCDLIEARWLWRQGQPSAARALLKPHAGSMKGLLTLLATFFPYKLMMGGRIAMLSSAGRKQTEKHAGSRDLLALLGIESA